MADQLLTGTTLVEKESRSIGDVPVGGIVEWDDTFGNLPDGFVKCDGSTINDPLSAWNGTAVQNLNTEYWTIPGSNFEMENEDDNANWLSNGTLGANATSNAVAGAQLPQGATVTGVLINGNGNETWTMQRIALDSGGTGTTMATATIDTEDTTITSGKIDNSTYRYYFTIPSFTYIVHAVRVTYTPRNKFIMRTR